MKVLIFCIHFRKKYLSAIGPEDEIFSKFDFILDIKKICKPDHGNINYNDIIKHDKVVIFDKIEELEKFFLNNHIELSLIFNPQKYENMKPVYQIVEQKSVKWGIIKNKSTLRTLNIKVFLSYILSNIQKLVIRKKILHHADFLLTNFSFFYKIDGLKFMSFKKVFSVRHFDAIPARNNTVSYEGNYGIFLDQYFPFHSANVVKKKVQIDPETYYSELENYLDEIKKRYKLDFFIISRHPNSNGEELKYIKKHKTDIGKSAQLTYGAQILITHYSDSLSFAIQLGKPFINVNLPRVLPEIMTEHIEKAVRKLSSEYHIYYGDGNIKVIKNNSLKRYLLKKVYKLFYNPDACFITDYITVL